MNYPQSLIEAIRYFSNPKTCSDFVANLRWPQGACCPTCGRVDVSYLQNQNRWQCKSAHPKRQFSVKTGTIFEDSPLGLDKWLPAVWMIVNAKNGISSYEIARNLQVTQKTAWFMSQRIREAMKAGGLDKLSGKVEADETYVGGEYHHGKKRSFENKTAIVGVVEKQKDVGKAKAFVTKRPDATNTVPFLNQNVAPGSVVHTDESGIYYRVKQTFEHHVVNHSQKEYVRDDVHTNTIEGLWNLFKRSYRGTYTHMSPMHLDRYVQEHVYRYNARSCGDGDRFRTWFGGFGRRLTYRELVGETAIMPEMLK